MKKMAETVGGEVTFSRLRGAVEATGVRCSVDSIIAYLSYVEDAYLPLRAQNLVASLSEKKAAPRRSAIVTLADDERTIERDGVSIKGCPFTSSCCDRGA